MKTEMFTDEMRCELLELLKDAWVSQKTGVKEKKPQQHTYISHYLPEIFRGGLNVLDIATGGGGFVDIAQKSGCNAFGVENVCLNNFCSNDKYTQYLRACKLLHIKNKLRVEYVDLCECIEKNINPFDGVLFNIVNCRYAINLIMIRHFNPNFKNGKNTNEGHWKIDQSMADSFDKMFVWIKSILLPGGKFMVSALTSTNKNEYSKFIEAGAAKNGFDVELSSKSLVHKMRMKE